MIPHKCQIYTDDKNKVQYITILDGPLKGIRVFEMSHYCDYAFMDTIKEFKRINDLSREELNIELKDKYPEYFL